MSCGMAVRTARIEFVQYEATKIVTGAMKGTSRRSLMHEIGWENMLTI